MIRFYNSYKDYYSKKNVKNVAFQYEAIALNGRFLKKQHTRNVLLFTVKIENNATKTLKIEEHTKFLTEDGDLINILETPATKKLLQNY